MFFIFFVSVFCQQEKSNATRKTKSTKAINIYLLAVLLHFQTEIVKSNRITKENRRLLSYSYYQFVLAKALLNSYMFVFHEPRLQKMVALDRPECVCKAAILTIIV